MDDDDSSAICSVPRKRGEFCDWTLARGLELEKVLLVNRAFFRDVEGCCKTASVTEGTPRCKMLPALSSVWQDYAN
jgi:hypothetical protein